MKYFMFFIICIFLPEKIFSQDFQVQSKSVTGVYAFENINSQQLYISVSKWITKNYNSPKNAIQLSDKESGTIIVKGVNSCMYNNYSAILVPNNRYAIDSTIAEFNHIIEINIKDGRMRMIFSLSNMVDNLPAEIDNTTRKSTLDAFFDCVSLDKENTNSIDVYNELAYDFLKKGLFSKNKIENYLSKSKELFDNLNKCLLTDIFSVFSSIQSSVKNESKDEW